MKADSNNLGLAVQQEECLGNYEGAMHFDCDVCQKEGCSFRKGGAKSSEIIAVMSLVGMLSLIVAVVVGKAIVALGK